VIGFADLVLEERAVDGGCAEGPNRLLHTLHHLNLRLVVRILAIAIIIIIFFLACIQTSQLQQGR